MSPWAFSSRYSTNLHCQAVRARKLKFFENVHLPPPVTCHISHVMCHISHVMCHMSHVTCHMSHVTFFLFFFGCSGETSLSRFCYQRALLRLVSMTSDCHLQLPEPLMSRWYLGADQWPGRSHGHLPGLVKITFTKPPLLQMSRLTGSGNPLFESCVEGKAQQREIQVYSWSTYQIPHDCTFLKRHSWSELV